MIIEKQTFITVDELELVLKSLLITVRAIRTGRSDAGQADVYVTNSEGGTLHTAELVEKQLSDGSKVFDIILR